MTSKMAMRQPVTAADYDRVLRLYRKHSRDQKQPLYRAYIDACERIEALETALRAVLTNEIMTARMIARTTLEDAE
jgi:hypothetical protein